uniref:Uncharacterized protein n=1 Tax=Arundo donax TaxID=35708 RepID=A0A0A9DZ66_ARUDO
MVNNHVCTSAGNNLRSFKKNMEGVTTKVILCLYI